MEYKDYYKILGVDKKASDAEIKKAFRTLAKSITLICIKVTRRTKKNLRK